MSHKQDIQKKKKIKWQIMLPVIVMMLLCSCFLLVGLYSFGHKTTVAEENTSTHNTQQLTDTSISGYSGAPYIEINENKPSFSEEDLTTEAFEHYSDLDHLGRCGTAYANLCSQTLPKEERGPIGEVLPSGWQVANYHELIDGNYLYNRCHLIAFSLAGENANEKNLITGTRYLNTEGMQPFELQVLGYVRETGNHVLYRVTPVFEGDNLIATGVEMEALSVEDHGAGVSFHIFAYNVQPGVIIDYKTGDNKLDPDYEKQEIEKNPDNPSDQKDNQGEDPKKEPEETSESSDSEGYYILNTNTHRFHYPSCDSIADIKEKNKKVSEESREEIMKEGYQPCGRCKP